MRATCLLTCTSCKSLLTTFSPTFLEFEITGLSPDQPYEFYMYPGAIAARDLNLTLDANADGSLLGETTVFIDAQATGVGQLFTTNTDENGRLFGQFSSPAASPEPNPSGFQLRELRKATVFRFR